MIYESSIGQQPPSPCRWLPSLPDIPTVTFVLAQFNSHWFSRIMMAVQRRDIFSFFQNLPICVNRPFEWPSQVSKVHLCKKMATRIEPRKIKYRFVDEVARLTNMSPEATTMLSWVIKFEQVGISSFTSLDLAVQPPPGKQRIDTRARLSDRERIWAYLKSWPIP